VTLVRSATILGAAVLVSGSLSARPPNFAYLQPGDLAPGSGRGLNDATVHVPNLRFPIERSPAYANSQVWGVGGQSGPPGSQCDVKNFSYPWRDNFCETRQWEMPLCPAGVGHQGQDLRAADCTKDVHAVVAVADGTITHIGSYSVYLTSADGTRFDYLHMSHVAVTVGQHVTLAQRLGMVSNVFNAATTVHLHFNIRQNIVDHGLVFVQPYMSLVRAYERLP
jgi:murein DD-endopeptidase MepM/ murein hydrolase activator NlpD